MDSRRNPGRALGAAVKTLRQGAGLSQEELAARAEVEPTLISKIEAGRADPAWGDMRRIAAALGTSVDRLAELVEELEGEG
jgi:transcriptional regulator with XRE-family HTH domain